MALGSDNRRFFVPEPSKNNDRVIKPDAPNHARSRRLGLVALSVLASVGIGLRSCDNSKPDDTNMLDTYSLPESGLICSGWTVRTVERGDTLYELVGASTAGESRLGVADPAIKAASLEIAEANRVDPEGLVIGSKIVIPEGEDACGNAGTGIAPGDYTEFSETVATKLLRGGRVSP